MAASLRSSDLIISAASPAVVAALAQPGNGDARSRTGGVAAASRAHGHPDRPRAFAARGGGEGFDADDGLPAALGLLFRTVSMVSRSTWAECWSAETSLDQSP